MRKMTKYNVTTILAFLAIAFVVGIAGVLVLDRNPVCATNVSLLPTNEGVAIPARGMGETFQLYRHMDFGDEDGLYHDALNSATSYTILTVPMNSVIRKVVAKCTHPEGATATIAIGYSNLTAESYGTFTSLTAFSCNGTNNASISTLADMVVTTNTLISIDPATADLDHAVVDIWVLGERLLDATGDED